jgi:hypothetical protein
MQRFNHMGLSVPEGTLNDAWRSDIDAFYGGIFGWKTSWIRRGYQNDAPPSGLHLRLDDWGDQYLVAVEAEEARQLTGMGHLGLLTESADEHTNIFEASCRHRDADDRLRITGDTEATTLEGVIQDDWRRPTRIYRSFTVQYLLPIALEIGYVYDAPGHEAPRRWTYS